MFSGQNITGTSKVVITTRDGSFNSLLLASVHDSIGATVNLYYASQVGTDITDTLSEVNGTFAKGLTTAVALTNTGTAATSDMFLNERVYRSDGTFVGICTVFTGAASITFGGGLEVALANDDDLYTGARYHVLKATSVPVGTSLVLDSNDIDFNNTEYKLYITLTAGSIDLTTRQ